ncbi:MAG: hypothetical protein KKB04_01725, partial [Candidatus Thermoplasmatota archaeon]|nr:hypothetical protein [Candidatus Thermoplasmatota archaeon]
MVIGLLILVFATSTLNPTVLLGKEVDIDQEVDVDHLDSEGLPEIILKQNPSVRNDIIPKAADDLVTLRIMYVINRQVKLEVYDYVPQSNLYKFFRDGTEIFSTTKYSDFNLYIDTVPSVGNYVYYAEISNETQTSISRNMTVHTGLMYGYTWEEDLTLAQGEYTIAARGPWYDEYEHEGFDVCHGNLTISSGATIRFQDGAKLWVNDGGIIAESNSKENPIRFIGPETRDAQIEISLDSKGNVFRNCTFVNLKGIMCNNMITSQYLDKGGIYIVDSYLHNNTYGVFSFGSSPWLERCDITQNEIGLTNRGGTNFLTGATYHGKPVIRHCNIYHNTQFGVHSLDSQGYKVDARYNWWGSGTGPYHPGTNPDGTGDNVSALVNYNPWIGLDPEITEVRVIQTIENYSLVAKKPTMVRVFLKCSQDLYNYEVALCIEYDTTYGQNSFDLSSTDSSCVLDFSCMNAPNPYKKTWSKKEKMQGLDSVNFIIPKYQLPTGIGTVTVKAELILDDPSTDPNPENNVKNITMAVGMQKEPLRIKFVPLKVGEWTNFTSDHQKEYLQAAEKHKEFIAATYPVSDIRFSVDMDYDITTDNTYLSYDGETI